MTLLLLSETWSDDEALAGRPFVGASGWLLDELLRYANISRDDCFITTVFRVTPKPYNDVINLTSTEKNSLPSFGKGKYLRAEFVPELARLNEEILRINPNLIVSMGSAALWAMTGEFKISKNRGTVGFTNNSVMAFPPRKYLGVYNPHQILKDYSLKPVTLMDMRKAKRHSVSPTFTRPSRKIYIPETMADIESAINYLSNIPLMAVDIETHGRQITCIGFAPNKNLAFVFPITKGLGSYWTEAQELYVWRAIRMILTNPKSKKIFQNGMYDLKFLWEIYGIPVANSGEDTMLLHHALYIESEKSLGFMGSVYTDEPSWKTMRSRDINTIKKED